MPFFKLTSLLINNQNTTNKMKKNITINLCGRLYQIDEDAYEMLSQYIDTLRNFFSKQEGGNEIVDDFEERIAELFDEQKAEGKEAITIENVQDIIKQIGNVEDFADEDAGENGDNTSKSDKSGAAAAASKTNTHSKKFYRDGNNKVFCGVLSGCANYLGGTATAWRWAYAAICFLWMLGIGFNPFTIGNIFSSAFFGAAALFVMVLCAPLALAPAVPYFLIAVFAKEAVTPEDQLKMKGKEVNPQNIAEEITEQTAKKEKAKNSNGITMWNGLTGIISIILSINIGILVIVFLCIEAALIFNSELICRNLFSITDIEQISSFRIPATIAGLILVANLGILLFCCIHSAVSSFKGIKPMTTKQRILWFVGWVVSVVCFVAFTSTAMNNYQKVLNVQSEQRIAEEQKIRAEHTMDGISYNLEDWDFYKKNGWRVVRSQDCESDRYTYSGEYMDGDESVRYIDVCNYSSPTLFTAQKTDSLQPGTYHLAAAVRSNNTNKFIFAKVGVSDSILLAEIPNTENTHGNIWRTITKETSADSYDDSYCGEYSDTLDLDLVKQMVDDFPTSKRRKIREYGDDWHKCDWSYVFIKNIVITEPTEVTYGVTTDEDMTRHESTTGYVSATDFKFVKVK